MCKTTALYERLSKDDEQKNESVSIVHQKQILEDYARKNGFLNTRHFTDDGVRGTTFKRPGLDAMLEEIRAGNRFYGGIGAFADVQSPMPKSRHQMARQIALSREGVVG